MSDLFRPTKIVTGTRRVPVRPPRTVKPPTESTGNNVSNVGTVDNDSVSTTEHELNIPVGIQSGDFLIYLGTLRRNAGDPEVNPPAGWTQRVDGSATSAAWAYAMTKVSDGTETDTTFTTNLATDVQASAGVTIALRLPEGWTIDVSSIQQNSSSATVTFPSVSLTGGSRVYRIIGAIFHVDPLGNFDITDFGTMTELANAGGGSGNSRVQVGSLDQFVTSASFTPEDWTADQAQVHGAVTLAIHAGAAEVASGDHAHLEADITDTATGVATILNGNSSIAVSHGLSTTPTTVLVTPRADPGDDVWVDTIGSSQFTINVGTNVVSDTDFGWLAFP